MSTDALGFELHRILAMGVDGHSGVGGYTLPGQRFLPFLLEPDGNRVIAFRSDRTGFPAVGSPT